MPLNIRPAQAEDQGMIRRIVRQAKLYPFDLSWHRFMVATDDNIVVGVGQVKSHGDGGRELASVAVTPSYQNQGVGTALIRRIISEEKGSIHLFCRPKLQGYYRRFGFKTTSRPDLPTTLARRLWLANGLMTILSKFSGEQKTIIAMSKLAADSETE